MFFESLEARRLLAAVRIATWNVQDGPAPSEVSDFTTVLEAIGNETRSGITQRINVLALQETNFTSMNNIESILEAEYGVNYERRYSAGPSGDSTAILYDTTAVTLQQSLTVCGTCTHPATRGLFRPVGTSGTSDFYVYSIHLKAGNSSSDQSRRDTETTLLRADADALGQGENVLFMGDFNTRSSSEAGFQNLLDPGNAQLQDPIDTLGTWHNNGSFSYKITHTQNPQNDPNGGYMDDRFDFQMVSAEVEDFFGFDYIAGTYRAFGNNGTHSLNGPITSGTGASTTVLNALAAASDHLPVVADYDIGTVTAEIQIIESGGGTEVTEGGASDDYLVVINSQPLPGQPVTVTVTPQDAQVDLGMGAGAPISLVFTHSDFSPKTVTVSAVDDSLVENTVISSLSHSSSSLDPSYDNLTLPDVDVTVNDEDASVVISEIMYNPVTEFTGTELEYIEIVNTGSAPVNLEGWRFDDEDASDWDPIPGGTILAPDQIAVFFDNSVTDESTFRSAWNVPASALVVGLGWGDLDNSPSGGNETLELLDASSSSKFAVQFDDAAPWPTDSPEGPSIYLEGLGFNPNFGQNWSRSQVGVENGRTPISPYAPGDVGSPGHAPGISSPGIALSVADVIIDEDAGTATFTISANAAPSSDVMVSFATADNTAVAGFDYQPAGGIATIGANTTSTQVVVNLIDDHVDEGNETFFLELSNATGDASVADAQAIATIVENDFAGVSVSQSDGSTDVAEDGATDTIEIVLDSEPTSAVSITLATADGETLASPTTLTFTDSLGATPWNIPQTVVISAVDDSIAEGSPHTGIVTLTASGDPTYSMLALPDVSVNIADNDGVTVAGEIAEFGGAGVYTMDFSVTAGAGGLIVGGFSLPIEFDVPGITFSGNMTDFAPDPALDFASVTPLASGGDYLFSALRTSGAGLTVAPGMTEVLFSLVLNADQSATISQLTEVASVVISGLADIVDDQLVSIDGVSFGGGISFEPTVAPTVTDVRVSGANWSAAFLSQVDPIDQIGVSLPGTEQLRPIPWTNVTTLTIDFSKAVLVQASDVSLVGVNVPSYAISVSPGSGDDQIVISLLAGADFDSDKVLLEIRDSVSDVAGNALDGEWVDASSTASGNDTPGGDFRFRFDVLEGDADGSGTTNIFDIFGTNAAQGAGPGDAEYDVRFDFDAGADINIFDLFNVNGFQGEELPLGDPVLPPESAAAAERQVEKVLRHQSEDLVYPLDAWDAALVDLSLLNQNRPASRAETSLP